MNVLLSVSELQSGGTSAFAIEAGRGKTMILTIAMAHSIERSLGDAVEKRDIRTLGYERIRSHTISDGADEQKRRAAEEIDVHWLNIRRESVLRERGASQCH